MKRESLSGEGDWTRDGFLRFPGFIGGEELRALERLCRRVVSAWKKRHAGSEWLNRTTNMAGLTDPGLFADDNDLSTLLEWIADERILAPLRQCAGGNAEPMFHNTQFFFEQPQNSWDGDWHRDTQFDAKGDDDEQARIAGYTGVHFRIAFARDPWLEIVPGSHRRWDTPDEYAIRRAADASERARDDMPGRLGLELEPGDALLFHAWAIHRGRYRTSPRRRTLDIIYGWPGAAPFATPQPLCFSSADTLDRLSPGARSFFERFVAAYRSRWAEASGSAQSFEKL